MSEYKPRLRPLVPVGHERWCAVSRVPTRTGPYVQHSDLADDEQIEWLLRAITTPGDRAQRRYDLESLAGIVTRNPKAGYGISPIDGDEHGYPCIVCRHAGVDGVDIFDDHEYTERGFCDIHFDMHSYNGCIGWRPPTDDEIKEHFA